MINTGGDLRGHLRGFLHDLYMSVGRKLLLIKYLRPQTGFSCALRFFPYVVLRDIFLLCLRSLYIAASLFLNHKNVLQCHKSQIILSIAIAYFFDPRIR